VKYDANAYNTAVAALSEKWPEAAFAHIGSTYIQGEGADLDILMYVPGVIIGDVGLGYTCTGNPSGEEDDFSTWRNGDVNLIISHSLHFHLQFKRAAEVCRFLYEQYGFGDKTIRIAVHRAIMNDESVEQIRGRLGLAGLRYMA